MLKTIWIWLGIFWSTILGSLLLSEVIIWLIESVYVLAYTFSLCSADEMTRDLQASWCMFEDPVTGKRSSGFLVDVWRHCHGKWSSGFLVDVWRPCWCWWDYLPHEVRLEQNTFYSSGLASESGIDQQFPLFCAFCFPMKLWKPLTGNKQGEKKTVRTSSVLDTLKGSMTFVWI